MLKITCGPATHYKILKSGAIRYQKSSVADPLWRLAAETKDRELFGRFFSEKPTLDSLWMCMEYILDKLPSEGVKKALIASSLESAIPGFADRLQQRGFDIFVPQGSSGGLAPVARRWDKLSDLLVWDMEIHSETDLTIGEYEALAKNSADVIGPVKRDDDHKMAHGLAEELCRLRGRDPSEGAQRWKSMGFRAPAHTSQSVAKDHDGLAGLIGQYSPDNVPVGYSLTVESQRIYDIAKCLEAICRNPDGSEMSIAGKLRLAGILQRLMLVEATCQLRGGNPWNYSGYLTKISMALLHWLGFESKEILAFKQGLADAYLLPSVIDGATYTFFRLPVHWQFHNGLEKSRTLRYLPWREIVEQHLASTLPTGSLVVLGEDLRRESSEGENRLCLCCSLIAIARFGYRYEEEKGKRASAAVPKVGKNKGCGQVTLTGVIRHPVASAKPLQWPLQWHPLVDQALSRASSTINGNLDKTLDSLTIEFGLPLPME